MKTAIEPDEPSLTISQAAKLGGVGAETVRFYERQGLVREAERSGAGYRLYSSADVRRLAFIRRAKDLGFSLKEIKELIGLTEHRHASAREVKAIATAKLERIREQIRDLQRIQKALSSLSEECSGAGPASHCPILNAMTLEAIGTPASTQSRLSTTSKARQ
jgi:MerR family copper efflux transcriptional regulator